MKKKNSINLHWLCVPIFKDFDGHIVAQLFVKFYTLTKLNYSYIYNSAKSKTNP